MEDPKLPPDSHDGGPSGEMSRRTFVRRGAVVGGTLLWAAPTIQSFARPAFAQTGTPVVECHEISNIQVLIRCGEQFLAFFKFEDTGQGTCVLEQDPGTNFPRCPEFEIPEDAHIIDSEAELNRYATVDCTDDCVWTVCLSENCTLVTGFVFGAGECKELTPAATGNCWVGGPIEK